MPNRQIQLFILPYAGGSVAAFRRLTDLIDDRVNVVTVEYPGHGTRAREPLPTGFWRMLEDATDFCLARRDADMPYAVLGYSMGSILAYEMAARQAIPGELKHLFLCAEVSPRDRALELRKVENPTDARILERARQLGGLDERLLSNRRFAEIYIRPMLSDYRLFFQYRFPEHPGRIGTDATFFYCEKDTPYRDVAKWGELIDGRLAFHELGENHFFINHHYEAMARVINRTLCPEVMT